MKKYSNSKTNKEIKIRRHRFLEKLSAVRWPNFSQIGSRVADLGDIHFEKTSGKDVWRSITRDEIISDYKTKAVNVDA